MKTRNIATIFAILAAALYAVNIPLSKVLLQFVQPMMMAAFLYLGAGVGLFLCGICQWYQLSDGRSRHLYRFV